MTENKLVLERHLLKGFRDYIEMTRQLTATLVDNQGDHHEIKIPRLAHEDLLCLYSIVAATYYSEQAVCEAIDTLTATQSLSDCNSLETYLKGCEEKPTMTFDNFFNRYNLPVGNLLLIGGQYAMHDSCSRIMSSFSKRKNPTRNFVEVFSWYLSLMFGADNFKKYLAEAHTIVNKSGHYILDDKCKISYKNLDTEGGDE